MELHYFPLRGLGEMTRLALCLAEQEWTEVVPEYSAMKADSSTYKFAVLPALKDGDVVLSQSLTMLRYVGRKFSLYGKSDLEAAQIDQIIDGVSSLRTKYLDLIYQAQLADDKKAAVWEAHGNPATARTGQRNGGAHWVYITDLLKDLRPSGEGFAVGQTASIADAILYDVTDLYMRIYGDEMRANYPELTAHHDFIEGQPAVATYISTKRCEKVNGNSLG